MQCNCLKTPFKQLYVFHVCVLFRATQAQLFFSQFEQL